eukprot:jgi/Orpsp1_1/1182734/evm.model.c7180000082490.1
MKFNKFILITQLSALGSAGLTKRANSCACSVEPSVRIECGFYGIQEDECNNRGCCWKPSNVSGTPWCYHVPGDVVPSCYEEGPACEIDERSRKDCGYYGINQRECLSRGCCWAESKVSGVPWCFYSKHITSTTTATTTTTTTTTTTNVATSTTITTTITTTISPTPTPFPMDCPVDERSREDCGYLGITKRQCVAGGCCWAESETEGIPWCFIRNYPPIRRGITVRFQKPDHWSTVNLWAWDENNKSIFTEAWPGKNILNVGNNWYTYTFPKEISSVNLLFNDGNHQTSDISDVSISSCFKLVGDSVMKTYDCAIPVPPCSYTVTELKSTDSGMTAILDLEDRVCEMYDIDIPTLDFQAKFETNDRLHVHIQPTNPEEYPHNVDVPAAAYPFEVEDGPNDDLQYSYTLTNDKDFKLDIKRKDGTPLFESMSFVFERQYLEISKRVDPSSAIYGFGEVFGPYRRNSENTSHALWNADNADPVGQNLYGSHPFYIEIMDGKAYGFFLKNSHGMQFSIQNGLMTIQAIGGNFDMYFFMGPSMEDVTRQYYQVIGQPALLPYWSLGWHQCRYGYRNINEVRNVVANYKNNNIPLDTMWIDIDYMENNKDFTYDRNNFPVSEVKKFVQELKNNHQYYINMIDPAIAQESGYAPFERGMQKDIFIKDKNGNLFLGEVWPKNLKTAFPDWHHPNIVEYWTNEIRLFKDLAMTD